MSYQYPDKGDALTIIEISNLDPYPGYWDISEETTLEKIWPRGEALDNELLLDIGAGSGRLSKKYASAFTEVIAVEPDIERHTQLQSETANIHNIKTIFGGVTDLSLPDSSCDAILLSHIIQHIDETAVIQLRSACLRLLKPGGSLILLTSHAQRLQDWYSLQSPSGSCVKQTIVTKDQFTKLITNPDGILPVHHWSPSSLLQCFSDFELIATRRFHVVDWPWFPDRFIFRDTVAQLPILRNYSGRDIALHLQKPI